VKGKKIAKSIYGKDEIESWNVDMLGEENAARLKKGLKEFTKKKEEKRGKDKDAEQGAVSAQQAATRDSIDSTRELLAGAAQAVPKALVSEETPQDKKEAEPKMERLSEYSYKLLRFEPGLGEDGYFQDYGDVDYRRAVSGAPDFGVAEAEKLETFKSDFLPLGNGGSVVYEIEDGEIIDGDGPDFVVYGDSPLTKGIKTATVEVAERDAPGAYVEFQCDSVNPPFMGCAGVHPVDRSHSKDPVMEGGDPFDLAKIGVKRAKFIRITDTSDNKNSASVKYADGFNLDSIALIHAYKNIK
jgi:hypothetical protein